MSLFLQIPNSNEEWYTVAKDFEMKWQFPNCIGALDGKHVVMKQPPNSGSLYFNYKGTNSIVLLALVDANYKFLYIDVGCNGRISDGGVFTNCSLSRALENNLLNVPVGRQLGCTDSDEPVPFVIVADDAFALRSYLLKPFPFTNQPAPNRIFNYRLSRARRVVENAFGLISARFRILRRPMEVAPETVKQIVLCICALHNYLLSTSHSVRFYASPGTFDTEDAEIYKAGSWREDGLPNTTMHSLQRVLSTKNSSRIAKDTREQFKRYFMTQHGEVSWQYKYI